MQSEPTEPQPPADPPPAQQPVRIRPVARRPALPPPPAKKRLVIGGLECFVYGLDKVKDEIPRVVLFLLHGRGSDHSCFEEFIRFLDLRSINRSRVKRQLLICTFDQRNHGSRCLDPNLNLAFDQNVSHGMDLFSVIYGTVRDINMLIEFLPGYLYPYNEDGVLEYGVLGVSQGAHAVWMTLLQQGLIPVPNRKLNFACSAIGCPDYYKLMEMRLSNYGFEPAEPYLPEAFKRFLRRLDLGTSVRRWEEGPPERMRGHVTRTFDKPILVLSGRDDKLVPLEASEYVIKKFQEILGEGGSMTVSVHDGVGHEFTEGMKEEFKNWLLHLLDVREES